VEPAFAILIMAIALLIILSSTNRREP